MRETVFRKETTMRSTLRWKELIIVSLFLFSAACSNRSSLGQYQGATRDLVPGEVGKYRFEKLYDSQKDNKFKKYFDNLPQTDYILSDYKEANKTGQYQGEIIVVACKTPSPETANRILERIYADYYGARGSSNASKEPKQKGGSVVGTRTELTVERSSDREITGIVWTNGSVVFVLRPVADFPMNEDLLGFEKQYPY
jgi:hypothetical protein